jgi:hypothetical protein
MLDAPLSSLCFAEKEFYLDEFHEKTLLFALPATDWNSETEMHAVLEVFETLLRNETRVLLLVETGKEAGAMRHIMGLHKQLARVLKTPHASPLVISVDEPVDQLCTQIWEVRERPAYARVCGLLRHRYRWCAVHNKLLLGSGFTN